jgi:hypothetical protein
VKGISGGVRLRGLGSGVVMAKWTGNG